jgi:hypothetical protein
VMIKLLDSLREFSPVLSLDKTDLLRWADFRHLRIRLPLSLPGLHVGPLYACWCVVKVLLLPPKPSDAELQAMPRKQQLGPWRQLLMAVKPQTYCPVPAFAFRLPGVGAGQSGHAIRPTYTTRRDLR